MEGEDIGRPSSFDIYFNDAKPGVIRTDDITSSTFIYQGNATNNEISGYVNCKPFDPPHGIFIFSDSLQETTKYCIFNEIENLFTEHADGKSKISTKLSEMNSILDKEMDDGKKLKTGCYLTMQFLVYYLKEFITRSDQYDKLNSDPIRNIDVDIFKYENIEEATKIDCIGYNSVLIFALRAKDNGTFIYLEPKHANGKINLCMKVGTTNQVLLTKEILENYDLKIHRSLRHDQILIVVKTDGLQIPEQRLSYRHPSINMRISN
jgi:hypothetical protein